MDNRSIARFVARRFNRNILYCKYKRKILTKDGSVDLIETFCIVNLSNKEITFDSMQDLIETFCIVNEKIRVQCF